jgi:hypothetical protein
MVYIRYMSYKNLLKLIKKDHTISSLYKNEENHPLKNKKPHVLMSVEEPRFEVTHHTTHEDTINDLRAKGFKVHPLAGKYGGKMENSMMIENPSPTAVKALMQLAKQTGQESIIYSDGNGSHEYHYVNGENEGKHHKGFGTSIPLVAPEDYFSTMEDGTMFSHSIDFDNLHDKDKSMLRQHFRQEKLKKNEGLNRVYIPQNIRKSEHTGKEIKLVHYSPDENLKEISPNFHGKRKIGSEVKRGVPEHKVSFFYREGTKPEDIVTTGAKAKYVAKLNEGHRLYDLGEDSESVLGSVKARADKKEINRGAFTNDDIHEELKNRGYHGFFNSKSSLPDVVAMFHPMDIHEKHRLHPEDFKTASATDRHRMEEHRNTAQEHARQTGHHNPEMLANLAYHFSRNNNEDF